MFRVLISSNDQELQIYVLIVITYIIYVTLYVIFFL